jgi:lipopolysaccharide transport system ATP-binding protein
MTAELVLRTEGLGKAYRVFHRPQDRLKQILLPWRRFYVDFWALRDVSLDVRRGEAIGLVGRNGAGKSTFLQLASGTIEPTSGTVERHGRIAALLELGAGFNPEFTGRENVMLSAMVMGLTKRQVEERFQSIADFAAIGDFIEMPVKTYSSGMYARLAFAVAAHVDADIMIVDEILSVGDIAFAQKCMRFIRGFRERGTLLFVSHSPDSVLALCDRAVWLDHGEVRDFGPAKQVCRDYIASLTHDQEDGSAFRIRGGHRKTNTASADHRAEVLRAEGLGTEVRVFSFDPEGASFGHGGGTIVNVKILDTEYRPAPLPKGGDEVILQIECQAHTEIVGPIVGFYVRDRLGQPLFGDNTFLTYRNAPLRVSSGERFVARFRFRLPYLPHGEYMVNAALAEGTQDEHVQHHWVHEAMILTVSRSSVVHGLIGIPMLDIEIEKEGGTSPEMPRAVSSA